MTHPPTKPEDTGNSQEENPGDAPPPRPRPLYHLVPVDRYGDSTGDSVPLEDLGDSPLPFRSQYLAMDWLNDSRGAGSLRVQPKEVMVS